MNERDLPDFLLTNGFNLRPGMFGAGRASPVPGLTLPPSLPPPPIDPPRLPGAPDLRGALGLSKPADIAFTAAAPSASPQTARTARAPSYRQPPAEVIAAAQNMQRRWGIPTSVSLAQWAIESGWGERMPKDRNNPFGVKAIKGQPSVSASTTEYDAKGRLRKLAQPFRKFASLDDAWEGRSKMLATSKLYAKAQPHLHDPDAFVEAIAPIYAPNNPIYAKTIKGMMRNNHLYQFNGLSPDPAQPGKP